jgi:hypothetical protein
MARYCSLVAPVRPMGTRSSLVVWTLQRASAGGAISEKGTWTRSASRLAAPSLWIRSLVRSPFGSRSREKAAPGMVSSPRASTPPFRPRRQAVGADLIGREVLRGGLAPVPVHQQVHAAAGAAVRDAEQALGGQFAEVGGEIGDDDEVVLFSRSSRPGGCIP